MARPANALIAALIARGAKLRFPTLAGITAVLFLVDLAVPDAIPLVDELLLGLAAALFGTWKKQREEGRPAE